MNVKELISSGVKLRASDMNLLNDRNMLVTDADALYVAIRNAYIYKLHVLLDKIKTAPDVVRAALAELDIPALNRRDYKIALDLYREIAQNLDSANEDKIGLNDGDQDD